MNAKRVSDFRFRVSNARVSMMQISSSARYLGQPKPVAPPTRTDRLIVNVIARKQIRHRIKAVMNKNYRRRNNRVFAE